MKTTDIKTTPKAGMGSGFEKDFVAAVQRMKAMDAFTRKNRQGGVLLPIFSLPSPHGIGTFGRTAYGFADYLSAIGASIWAMLPLGPTGYGDSPYQSVSSNALNPYFLDLDMLVEEGLLTEDECRSADPKQSESVDYGHLYFNRYPLLMTAYDRVSQREGYAEAAARFEAAEPWVRDYALFMAIKKEEGGRPWYEWPEELRRGGDGACEAARTRLAHDVGFYTFLQYKLYSQWNALRSYVNSKGIRIMGDMPIYCAYDSVECWSQPEEFQLDADLRPTMVAGVPPDYFCEDGQLWGNPLYDWEHMRKNGFRFWLGRIRHACKLYDILRIDHFRGFESCYSVPYGESTARNGIWRKAYGFDLFRKVNALRLPLEIVAEDLGFITRSVKILLTKTGFAGMRVAEFAYDGKPNNPHTIKRWDGRAESVANKAAYSGTHDNPPVAAWLQGVDEHTMQVMRTTVGKQDVTYADIVREVLDSDNRYAIIPVQDIFGLGEHTRTNTPATVSSNWVWRMSAEQMDPSLCPFDFSRAKR